MKKIDFKEIFQETCIIQENRIGFFYINNIIFIFKKDKANNIKKIIKSLLQTLIIKVISKLK